MDIDDEVVMPGKVPGKVTRKKKYIDKDTQLTEIDILDATGKTTTITIRE